MSKATTDAKARAAELANKAEAMRLSKKLPPVSKSVVDGPHELTENEPGSGCVLCKGWHTEMAPLKPVAQPDFKDQKPKPGPQDELSVAFRKGWIAGYDAGRQDAEMDAKRSPHE